MPAYLYRLGRDYCYLVALVSGETSSQFTHRAPVFQQPLSHTVILYLYVLPPNCEFCQGRVCVFLFKFGWILEI